MKKILCICLSSTLQRTITFENLKIAQVNRSKYYRLDASGKAINSARVLTQLEKGCATILCPLGEKNLNTFIDAATRDELELCYVTIPGATRECWTLLDRTNESTTELVVSEPLLENEQEKKEVSAAEIKFLKFINEKLNDVDAVLLAGSRPKIWSEDLYSTICGITHDRGKIFLADFIGEDLQDTLKKSVPDIIKINEEEFRTTFQECKNLTLKDAIIQISSTLKNIIVITRGCDSTFAAENGIFYECPSEKIKPINTTACGDSFNAGFLYEYLNTNNIDDALKKGTWCAARNAELEVPGAIYSC